MIRIVVVLALFGLAAEAAWADGMKDARRCAERSGELNSAKPVVVVCRAGGRSAQATVILRRGEFTDIANLAGGMLLWRAQHCVVEGGRD